MRFLPVKHLIRSVDRPALEVDGTAETARLFVPRDGRRIELVGRRAPASRRVTFSRRSGGRPS